MNGTNHDEWRWPIARTELRTGKPLAAERYVAEAIDFFGEDLGKKIAAEYPLDRCASPSEALAAAETDANFSCTAVRVDALLARHDVAVYGYEFNVPDAPMYMPKASFPYRAAHAVELQFIFPRFHGGSGTPHALNPAETALSKAMVGYWTRFAKRRPERPRSSGLAEVHRVRPDLAVAGPAAAKTAAPRFIQR